MTGHIEQSLGRGHFFAVDRRVWAKASSLGINVAIAYLVMARGTGRDMRTTSWSAKAMEQRTSVPWRECKSAVQAVVLNGLAKLVKGGQHPQYALQSASGVPGCLSGSLKAPLSIPETLLLAKIRDQEATWVPKLAACKSDWGHISTQPWVLANVLVGKGVLIDLGNQRFSVAPASANSEAPDWTWLPNSIVDGAIGETSPLELIRQSANKLALRLFIDLYHAQSLGDYGGVHWMQLRRQYERQKVGAQGPFVVWGFAQGGLQGWRNAPFFEPHLFGKTAAAAKEQWAANWAALDMLESTGLFEFVGHVINADSADATVIHPYAINGGESGERAIAEAAHKAGLAMLSQWKQDDAIDRSLHLLPVRKHMTDVQIVGLVRLRYRARTSVTAEWLGNGWDEWTERFKAAEAHALGLDVDINGGSMANQRLVNGR